MMFALYLSIVLLIFVHAEPLPQRGAFRAKSSRTGSRATRLKRPRCAHECRNRKRQTSVTAGTFKRRSHVSLKSWFRAILLATGCSNGIPALQFKYQIGVGYKASRLLLQKLCEAMKDANAAALFGVAEADETSVPFRSRHSERPSRDRSP